MSLSTVRYFYLASETEGCVDFPQEAAGDGGEQAGMREAMLSSQGFPGGIGQGIGHPQIAAIGVVFDQEQTPGGTQIGAKEVQHRSFVAHKVERIGHEQAIKRWQRQLPGKISLQVFHAHAGKVRTQSCRLLTKSTAVPIDRINLRAELSRRERGIP